MTTGIHRSYRGIQIPFMLVKHTKLSTKLVSNAERKNRYSINTNFPICSCGRGLRTLHLPPEIDEKKTRDREILIQYTFELYMHIYIVYMRSKNENCVRLNFGCDIWMDAHGARRDHFCHLAVSNLY